LGKIAEFLGAQTIFPLTHFGAGATGAHLTRFSNGER